MSRGRRLGALTLRLWTLATRFVLIFFLARFLLPSEVGLYGLLVATMGYVVYLLGMDMYTYTNREILKAPAHRWRPLAKSHTAFLLLVYVIVLPLLLLLFAFGLLPWALVAWFFILVVTEHLALEIDRMLVAMSDQFSASLVVFLRQAMMPSTIVPLMVLVPESRNLTAVLVVWTSYNVVAIVLGIALIARKVADGERERVDWAWIRSGILVSLAFLTGTLLLRVLFAADRQIVAIYDDLEVLGAYTFALSVGTGLSSTLSVAVHQFGYPKVVIAAHERDREEFNRGLKTMGWQTAIVVSLAAIAVVALKDWLVAWVGGGIYAEYSWLLPASLGVYALYNASIVPHYGLYALHKDRTILAATGAALLTFIVTVVFCLTGNTSAVVSVLLGLSAASIILIAVKWVGYRHAMREHFATRKE